MDPNATGSSDLGLFGVPTKQDASAIILLPVPWEVTTSYGSGTSRGPEAILRASAQLDLFDRELGRAYERGYHLLPVADDWLKRNDELKKLALKIREQLETTGTLNRDAEADLKRINQACKEMADWVYQTSKSILQKGQIPAVIGGDHSSPEGLIRAICEKDPMTGVLHVDAHADLRVSYQGFERSHASIMNNVLRSSFPPQKLVQVGIRDFCEQEFEVTETNPRVKTFFDIDLKRKLFSGNTWDSLCDEIVNELPKTVYLSIDIDGLSPEFCPHTGTPVPGGLSFDQLNYLFSKVVFSGRRILGFDLNEVAPDAEGLTEWDANVGARLLYKMCGWTIRSQENS